MGPAIDNTNSATRASGRPTPAFVRARWTAWAALACCLAGVWASDGLGGGSAVWFGAALAMGVAAAATAGQGGRSRKWWRVVAAAGLVCLAGGWAAVRFREPAPDRLDRLVAEGSILRVRGVVLGSPELADRPEGPAAPGYWRGDSAWFPLRVTGVGDGAAAGGRVRVFGGDGLVGLVGPGDRVELTGVFRPPSGPRNPGEPDWARLGNEAGRAGGISVGEGGTVRVVGQTTGPAGWWAAAVRFRERLRARAAAALGLGGAGEHAGVLGALVLGERDASFEGVYRVFQRAGVAHVLAVSGFHLVLLCGLAAGAVRLTGERGRLETLAIVLVVVTLLLFVPARSPIVRAGVLALALVAGDALGRRWDRLAVLAWAGVGLLVWKPSEAMSLGYLLSVGVTALLIAMAERARGRRWSVLTRRPTADARWWAASARAGGGWVWSALRLNAACWLASAPTIIAATGVLSLLAPVATVVIVPVAGVLLVVGWAQAMLGVVWPEAAGSTRWMVDAVSGLAASMAGWFDGLPGSSLLVVGVGWVWAACATAAVLGVLFWTGRRVVFAGVLAVCVAYAAAMSLTAGRVEGIRVDMFDVGDGTSVLIRSGSEAVLWDCGSLQREVGGRVADAAIALGVRRVSTAVITHPNLDHFNGMPVFAERMRVERVLVPPMMAASREGGWGAVRAELEAMGVAVEPIAAGDRWAFGRGRVEVLWPPEEVSPRLMGNDGSVVARFVRAADGGQATVLMTGDVQRAGIAGLLEAGADLRADVVEVPHHGSADEAAMELVASSGAVVALQSSGPSRLNDDRWAAVRAGVPWLSTADRGAVWVLITDGSEYETGSMIGPSDADGRGGP